LKNDLGDGSVTLKSLNVLKNHCIRCGKISDLQLNGIKPERVAMVIGGLAILIGMMESFNIAVIYPIEAGLRMGVMWDLYLRATKRDRREQAIMDAAQIFHVDIVRAERVTEMVRSLYLQLKPSNEDYLRLLAWAAMLHEVGLVVSHTGYHKHGAYMVETSTWQVLLRVNKEP